MSLRAKRKMTRSVWAAISSAAVVAALTYASPAAAIDNYGETREQAVERCGENAEPVWSEFGWQCVDVNSVWSEFVTDDNGKYVRGSTGGIVPLCSQKAIGAAQDRGYGVCHPTDSRFTSARFDARSQSWVRSTDPQPRPIRTITEGQSTAFTVPNPQNRQNLGCSGATSIAITTTVIVDGVELSTTTYKTIKGGVRSLPDTDERTSDESFDCGTGHDRVTWGVCRGPYAVQIISRDDRVDAAGNRRVAVSTSADDSLDDIGTVEIAYYLNGTRTKSSATHSGVDRVEDTDCSLYETVRVEVRPGRRRGMSAAVSLHAPPNDWLDGTTTSNWTCTQVLLNYYAEQDPLIPAPCSLGDEVSTTTKNEFATPSRCVVIVTVARNGRGHGSTSCLPRSRAPDGWQNLPDCPLSTGPEVMDSIDGDNDDDNNRKRCVARN